MAEMSDKRGVERIKITSVVPVAKAHGLTVGREFGADKLRVELGRYNLGLMPKRGENDDTLWVIGDRGIMIKLLDREYDIIEQSPEPVLEVYQRELDKEAPGEPEDGPKPVGLLSKADLAAIRLREKEATDEPG